MDERRAAHPCKTFEGPIPSFDASIYGPLYRELAAEDRALAEQGMDDYARGLEAEDKVCHHPKGSTS